MLTKVGIHPLLHMAPERPKLRVGFILAQRFTLSAFATLVDHLRLAADEGDRSRPVRVQWSIMSARQQPISASCGVLIQPTSAFLPPEELDYVAVVGGLLHTEPQIDEPTLHYLRQLGTTRLPLIGICTGSFVLCAAGVMQGHRSCVSWYHYQDFRRMFPDHEVVADRLFLTDGLRTTCAGGAGTAALAAHLIERHLGCAAAHKATQILLFDRPRHANDAQPHPPICDRVNDPQVRRALLVMEQNLTRPIPLHTVANKVGISLRHLERLCHTHVGLGPARLYRQLRMRFARWLIENTDRPVTEIAFDLGFNDSTHFSRVFKRVYGLPPSRHRLDPHRVSDTDKALMRVFG